MKKQKIEEIEEIELTETIENTETVNFNENENETFSENNTETATTETEEANINEKFNFIINEDEEEVLNVEDFDDEFYNFVAATVINLICESNLYVAKFLNKIFFKKNVELQDYSSEELEILINIVSKKLKQRGREFTEKLFNQISYFYVIKIIAKPYFVIFTAKNENEN